MISYRQVSQAFEATAEAYDAWYEDNPLYQLELKALSLLGPHLEPSLEVGVGTGRFASPLKIGLGLDPAFSMLKKARDRGVRVVCGQAEALPFKDGVLKTIFCLFSLCFFEREEQSFKEMARVLRVGGELRLAFINKVSSWGRWYEKKASQGHPLYSLAHFYHPQEVLSMARKNHLGLRAAFSGLLRPPGDSLSAEVPKAVLDEGAGIIILALVKLS
ncbi:class I SAM-dependent methyltransferase [Thermosulfuriphilus sp.]